MSITSTTTSFDLHNIQDGCLAILCDQNGVLIGSGVIVGVEPLELTIAMNPVKTIGYSSEFLVEKIVPYTLHIKFVESGEIQLYVINPNLYRKGEDNAPVHH